MVPVRLVKFAPGDGAMKEDKDAAEASAVQSSDLYRPNEPHANSELV